MYILFSCFFFLLLPSLFLSLSPPLPHGRAEYIQQLPTIVLVRHADLPLPDKCVDVVVICLALMGNDYYKFLSEAKRILKKNGQLLIAEVSWFSSACRNHPILSSPNCRIDCT